MDELFAWVNMVNEALGHAGEAMMQLEDDGTLTIRPGDQAFVGTMIAVDLDPNEL